MKFLGLHWTGKRVVDAHKRFFRDYRHALQACGDGYNSDEIARVVSAKTERLMKNPNLIDSFPSLGVRLVGDALSNLSER